MIQSYINKFADFKINLVFQMAQLHPLYIPTISTQQINSVQCLRLCPMLEIRYLDQNDLCNVIHKWQ